VAPPCAFVSEVRRYGDPFVPGGAPAGSPNFALLSIVPKFSPVNADEPVGMSSGL
jgi:hypothetical protein